jgi:hypothetical protein
MRRLRSLRGSRKILAWAVIGLVIGLAFGLVWHVFEPGLGIYFWPVLGALILGQHAFRSDQRIRDGNRDEPAPPSAEDTMSS